MTEVSSRTEWQNENITHVRPEPVAEKSSCGKCGRILRSATSIRRGYGRFCWSLIRRSEEKVSAGYSVKQVESAHELIEDVAIVQIKPRVFRSVSSDGTSTYLTAVSGQCNCPAGLRGMPCYHGLAARILAGVPAPVSGPAITTGNPAPAFLATVCQYGDTDPVTHTVKNIRGVQGLCASHAAGYGYPQYLTPLAA
ncbi:DUF6011 domain-containing protein [Streptomyces tauricus]|uniref:DUF6011 domain-containing protein n=1 Tax=Streptomyces tauricus TaxID=68274 RepID=A0ABZ1JDI5_9ACTN|nr:DUF6011 domain-containing protein [Streptomyces tauricus]